MGKYIEFCMSVKDEMYDIALGEINGLNEEEARYFLMNDAVPVTGAVSGLIYYSETEKIGCEYYCEIIEMMSEIYGNEIPYKVISSLNSLTWFAWEYIVLGNESNIDEIIEIAKDKEIIEFEDEEDEEYDD